MLYDCEIGLMTWLGHGNRRVSPWVPTPKRRDETVMRLSARWLAQFGCQYYQAYRQKPVIGQRIDHSGCKDPLCRVVKIRDRDQQEDMPKIR